jgi:hypothetical protein
VSLVAGIGIKSKKNMQTLPLRFQGRKAGYERLRMGLSSDVLAPFQKGLSALSQSLRAETACRGA